MSSQEFPADAPATDLFPQFGDQLYDMISSEVRGLTGSQLDFESERWEWAQWSIRRNLSHMASGDFRWFWTRWGLDLFPGGLPESREIEAILDSPYDRRLDETKYWALEDILAMLRRGLDFAGSVLSNETVGSMRAKEIESAPNELWSGIREAGYSGIRPDPVDPGKIYITLEATFRHRYFEHITHLYNIQRLKRAQGLSTVVDIPMEGYLALPSWDLSQP
ncbi:MAG: hypothetical protein BZY88_07725 [SAR202 cluster bacterium Io17-Chloro-G9]|nr:MAG: hypothetical protein BZY88_07725 [SAR202 cluster bacterium Io17-Chloro-G9]